MKALEYVAEVDERWAVHVVLPRDWKQKQVRVLVLGSEGDDNGEGQIESVWMPGIAREWAAELADEREDIYTLADGEPVHATR